MLPMCNRRTRLQDPDRKPRHSAIKVYSDAAGGSLDHLGHGVGVAIYPGTWAYLPHGIKINAGSMAYDGKSLANKLSVGVGGASVGSGVSQTN